MTKPNPSIGEKEGKIFQHFCHILPLPPTHPCSLSPSLPLFLLPLLLSLLPSVPLVPRGASEHHLPPGLRQRGDWDPPAVSVAAACHRGAGRGRQVEGPPGHHRVHAPAGRTAGETHTLTDFEIRRLTASVYLLMLGACTDLCVCVFREWSSLMRSSTHCVWLGSSTTVRPCTARSQPGVFRTLESWVEELGGWGCVGSASLCLDSRDGVLRLVCLQTAFE